MRIDSQLNNSVFLCSETQDAFSVPHMQSAQACSICWDNAAGLGKMIIKTIGGFVLAHMAKH